MGLPGRVQGTAAAEFAVDLFASECPSRRGTMRMGSASCTNDEIPFGLAGALRRLDELTPSCIHLEDIAATVNPFAPAGFFHLALMGL